MFTYCRHYFSQFFSVGRTVSSEGFLFFISAPDAEDFIESIRSKNFASIFIKIEISCSKIKNISSHNADSPRSASLTSPPKSSGNPPPQHANPVLRVGLLNSILDSPRPRDLKILIGKSEITNSWHSTINPLRELKNNLLIMRSQLEKFLFFRRAGSCFALLCRFLRDRFRSQSYTNTLKNPQQISNLLKSDNLSINTQ